MAPVGSATKSLCEVGCAKGGTSKEERVTVVPVKLSEPWSKGERLRKEKKPAGVGRALRNSSTAAQMQELRRHHQHSSSQREKQWGGVIQRLPRAAQGRRGWEGVGGGGCTARRFPRLCRRCRSSRTPGTRALSLAAPGTHRLLLPPLRRRGCPGGGCTGGVPALTAPGLLSCPRRFQPARLSGHHWDHRLRETGGEAGKSHVLSASAFLQSHLQLCGGWWGCGQPWGSAAHGEDTQRVPRRNCTVPLAMHRTAPHCVLSRIHRLPLLLFSVPFDHLQLRLCGGNTVSQGAFSPLRTVCAGAR